MLIQFTVGNFLSFKENKTLSMLASSDATNRDDAVFNADNLSLLKTGILYGANASGKSNLIQAMMHAEAFINTSSKEGQVTDEIDWVDSYKFSTETENSPSFFEFVFVLNDKRYRYGFEVDKKKVCSEWLYQAKTIKGGTEKELFLREKKKISIKEKDFNEGIGIDKKTRDNALFLSVVANFDGKMSSEILKYFYNNFFVVIGFNDQQYGGHTIEMIEKKKCQEKIQDLLNRADLQIDDFKVDFKIFEKKDAPKNMPLELIKKLIGKKIVDNISTFHKVFNKNNKNVGRASLQFENESRGTQKVFNLSGLIIKFLTDGGTLIIDELDTSLHPKITEFILRLFNSKKTNPNNAQLIFATHDTNLLGSDNVRRDQVWFAEKNKYGATDLYSLLEYKPRKDASLEKGYLMGRYGAIPFINYENLEITKQNDCK